MFFFMNDMQMYCMEATVAKNIRRWHRISSAKRLRWESPLSQQQQIAPITPRRPHNRTFSAGHASRTQCQHAQLRFHRRNKENFLHKYECKSDCIDFLNALVDRAHSHLGRIVVCELYTMLGCSPRHAHCTERHTQRRPRGGAQSGTHGRRARGASLNRARGRVGQPTLCIDTALLFRIDN